MKADWKASSVWYEPSKVFLRDASSLISGSGTFCAGELPVAGTYPLSPLVGSLASPVYFCQSAINCAGSTGEDEPLELLEADVLGEYVECEGEEEELADVVVAVSLGEARWCRNYGGTGRHHGGSSFHYVLHVFLSWHRRLKRL